MTNNVHNNIYSTDYRIMVSCMDERYHVYDESRREQSYTKVSV